MKKRIKILQIGMSENYGGIENYIYNLFKNSNSEEFQFDFIDISKTKIAFNDEIIKEGAKIHKIIPRTKNYLCHIKELKKIIKNNNYDIIHIHIMDYSWFEPIRIANKYAKAKLILHSHSANSSNTWSIKHRMLHKIGKKLCKNITATYVACGEKAGQFMFGNNKFVIFNNGIEINKFKFHSAYRNEIRKENHISDETTIIGLVASLEMPKNHLFLMEIFKEYQKLNSNSKLILVGEGKLRARLEEKIKDYGFKDKVLFLGKRMDINKIYSAFDIYVMPSLFEGLSISLVEAQTNGLKCYTSDSVDKNSNITGNVEFLSLKKSAKEWAEYIFNSNNKRDNEVLDKIPAEFKAKKSYERVFQYYIDKL